MHSDVVVVTFALVYLADTYLLLIHHLLHPSMAHKVLMVDITGLVYQTSESSVELISCFFFQVSKIIEVFLSVLQSLQPQSSTGIFSPGQYVAIM